MIKHHEFWHPRLFEIPYYLSLVAQCCFNGIGFKSLAKANYALNHGDIGIGSKYESQLAFDQQFFMPTALIKNELLLEKKQKLIEDFADKYGYPLILKSDIGCVGKGLCKLSSLDDVKEKAPLLLGDYIIQQFTPYEFEYGIFFTRQQGVNKITGMNKKHFPFVVGNGVDSLLSLARQHERYSHHWHAFLQALDTSTIPKKGEKVRLSFIGSHTLGCKFTDDTQKITPALQKAIDNFFDSQPGYNFGRCDVKAESEEALLRGEFVVIEVNGVASLPTHMFDPSLSVWQAYKIFLQHSRLLASIAKEHHNKPMELLPYREIIAKVKANQSMLNRVHNLLKGDGQQ